MSELLVRDVAPSTVASLKARARRHRHSVEGEVREVLTELVDTTSRAELIARINAFRSRLEATGRDFGDSTAEIREDRDR